MNFKAGFRYLLGLMFLILGLAPAPVAALDAFHVHVDYVDNSKFPQVEAYISVLDANGLPIHSLTEDMFSITEDSKTIGAMDFGSVQNVTQPLAVALLMDTGAKMWTKDAPTPLEKSVEVANSFLDQLASVDQVAVIKFSDQPATVSALSADKYSAKQALGTLQPQGNQTALYDAVVEGVKALNGYSGRRVIVLVTNGQDTHSGVHDLDGAVREAQSAGIPVFVMGFGNKVSIAQLTQITGLTGGFPYIKQSQDDLRSAFDALLRVLHEQYRVGYLSSSPANNTEHELLVAVKYNSEEERTTYRFIAMSNSIPVSLPDLHEGDVAGGLVNFVPTVDWPAPLASLDITMDGVLLKTVTSAPFEYKWNSIQEKVSSGSHKFVLKATDIAGNTGQYEVNLDIEPPISVKITSLKQGEVVGKPVTITADVKGLNDITIQKVEFLVDGTVIASPLAPPYQAAWDATKYSAGPHSVSVVAYDNGGLFPTTEQINVNVEVGSYSWMVPIVALAVFALIIPFALRSRRRRGRTQPVAAASGQVVLQEIEGMNPGQVWPLGNSQVRLGRKRDENDIPLKGLNASRRHAYISFEQGQYVIYPLSPNNPVLVNNAQVSQKQVLQPGDVIRMGETTLRYEK